MFWRPVLFSAAVATVLTLITSCQSGSPPAGTPNSTSVSASGTSGVLSQPATTPQATLPGTSQSTTGKTRSPVTSDVDPSGDINAADPLLARQLNIAIYGGGGDGGPSCEAADPATPVPAGPEIALQGAGIVDFPKNVELCLSGFDVASTIALTVTAGGREYQTVAVPSPAPYPGTGQGPEPDMPISTLFVDGREIAVYSRARDGSPVPGHSHPMVSLTWRFLPPRDIRDNIVRNGQFGIRAVQGAHAASVVIPVHAPRERDYSIVRQGRSPARYLFVLQGFRAGVTVPIGLYKYYPYRNGKQPYARLVKQLGEVHVPQSGVAVFPVPYQAVVTAGPAMYCLLPPEDNEPTCEGITIIPDYPGQVTPGDTGSVVRKWQQIFITVGLLEDEPLNRDGHYGPRMQAAVKEYAGIATARSAPVLDREFYERIKDFG